MLKTINANERLKDLINGEIYKCFGSLKIIKIPILA